MKFSVKAAGKSFAAALFALTIAGCATIVGEQTQLLPVSSAPSGASVVITDETGAEVYRGETPTTVTLEKSDGTYWGGKNFTVKVNKSGYQEQTIPVVAAPNGWYIAGNLVFGGLIGWFIVDPLGGAMYTLSPDKIDANLGDDTAHNNRSADGISIVLLEDVPPSLRAQMKRIN